MRTSNYFLWFLFCVILVFVPESEQCEDTLTTVSGRSAPSGKLCKDQLVFMENFDWFNRDTWKHEVNMHGGGVSILEIKWLVILD